MGMFNNNQVGTVGYESEWIKEKGDYIVRIGKFEYNDQYFPKYNISCEVVSGKYKGKQIKGQIAQPKEQFRKAEDIAIGGFSFNAIAAYVAGAGVADEVNALPKITIKKIGDIITGKIIKCRVDKQSIDKEYYEIKEIYANDSWDINEIDNDDNNPNSSFVITDYEDVDVDADDLPF